jgi:hypothetical protein
VWKRKIDAKGRIRKHKARLCARGFQQKEGFDYNETFASVINSTSWRLLIAIGAVMGWQVHAMDVVTAFLNGKVKENIYLLPP